VLVRYQEPRDALSGLGRLFEAGGATLEHTDHYFVPNVTRVDYRWGADSGFAITSQCTPVGPLESMVYTAIGYRLPVDLPGALVARAIRPLVRWYTRQVIRQDAQIMQVQREGLAHPGGGRFAGTEADLLHAYVESYRRWLLEGGEGAGPADESRQIVLWT
jgi:hypothetical protein